MNEIRIPKSYKCTDKVYKKAIRVSKKKSMPLATLIEKVVIAVSEGKDIYSQIDDADKTLLNCHS